MKSKQLYYRRKGSKVLIEGVKNKKTEYIATLPDPEKLMTGILELTGRKDSVNLGTPKDTKLPSFFKDENVAKIVRKITRLDTKEKGDQK